jgi:hypothetical protein
MIEDELVKIWQSSPSVERVKFEKARLMIDVQSSIDLLDKLVKYRDIMEIAAVILLVPAFIFGAFHVPHIISKIACILIVLWGLSVAYLLLRARRHKPGPYYDDYLQYLRKSRGHLKAQKQLVDTILYWYILPAQLCIGLFMLGFGKMALLKMGTANFVLGIFVYIANRKLSKKLLAPRLAKVEELIAVMERN